MVYSYHDQGYNWLSPHVWDGLFRYKSGWLVYTHLMFFTILGFISLYRKKKYLFYPSLIFSLIFIYIAFAWDVWWYGASLRQRTIMQTYAILIIPQCTMIDTIEDLKSKLIKVVTFTLIIIFNYAIL